MANKRNNAGITVFLNDVRLLFAQNVIQKSKYTGPGADPNAKEKYQLSCLIEKGTDNFTKVMAAIVDEAKAEWGDAAEEMLRSLKSLNEIHCLTDGNSKKVDEYPHYKDKFVVSAKNEIRPTILCGGPDGRNEVKGDALPDAIFSGCYVNAIIKVVAGSVPKKQIYAYFLGVQYSKEGERIGGGVAKASDFAPVASKATAGNGTEPSGAAAVASAKDLF